MFCPRCGAESRGNRCLRCGATIGGNGDHGAKNSDWANEVRYRELIRNPQIRDLIRKHAAKAKNLIRGDVFLGLCDRALSPPGGVSLQKVAEVIQPIYAKLDLKTGQFQTKNFNQPPGLVLVALLCSMARHGDKLRKVWQGLDGCVLEASIPSDKWSFEGEMVVSLSREGEETRVEAATLMEGQWGRRKHCLESLLADIEKNPEISWTEF